MKRTTRMVFVCMATEQVLLYVRLYLALCVCTDPVLYTSLWLKCVVISQRIVNTNSVSESTVGLRDWNSLYNYKN